RRLDALPRQGARAQPRQPAAPRAFEHRGAVRRHGHQHRQLRPGAGRRGQVSEPMIELETTTPFFQDKQEVVDEILSRYPEEGRRSALMPLLWEVQRAERYISEARMHEIAEIVGITATEVKGVLSFYSTYHEQPVGRYHIQICSTLSCALAGADEMYDHLVNELGIVNGETDAEGRFSLQKAECVGSCGTAPVLLVNDTYYERVSKS